MNAPDECEALGPALSAYVDGELRCDQLRLTVILHLRSCFACQETLQGFRDLDALFRSQPAPEPPPERKDRLLAVLKAKLLEQ